MTKYEIQIQPMRTWYGNERNHIDPWKGSIITTEAKAPDSSFMRQMESMHLVCRVKEIAPDGSWIYIMSEDCRWAAIAEGLC